MYNYSVILYEGLGLSNTVALLLAAVYVTIATCGNYVSSLLIDRVGRVKLLRKIFPFIPLILPLQSILEIYIY